MHRPRHRAHPRSAWSGKLGWKRAAAGSQPGFPLPARCPALSRLGLRYDVTQDDALWEVRSARRAPGGTEENAGGEYALRLRPDLDLSGLGRAGADARTRLTLAEEWPTTESVGWGEAFGLPPGLTGDGYAVTQAGGRVVAPADYRVLNPTAAATVALAGLVPWGACSEIDWLAEPTGL